MRRRPRGLPAGPDQPAGRRHHHPPLSTGAVRTAYYDTLRVRGRPWRRHPDRRVVRAAQSDRDPPAAVRERAPLPEPCGASRQAVAGAVTREGERQVPGGPARAAPCARARPGAARAHPIRAHLCGPDLARPAQRDHRRRRIPRTRRSVAGVRRVRPDRRPEGQKALGAYQQPFLHDYPAFEWAIPVRDELAVRFTELTLATAELLLEAGDHTSAIAVCRRLLAHDPFVEPAYEVVAAARLAAGDSAGAHRAFRECERLFEEELDIRPTWTLNASGVHSLRHVR